MSTLRGIKTKIESGADRELIKIAMIQVAVKNLKSDNEVKKGLAVRILASPDWFIDRIYILVMADDRIVDDTPDSIIVTVVTEILSYFENING